MEKKSFVSPFISMLCRLVILLNQVIEVLYGLMFCIMINAILLELVNRTSLLSCALSREP